MMKPPTFAEIRQAFPHYRYEQLFSAASTVGELPFPMVDEQELTWPMCQAAVIYEALHRGLGAVLEEGTLAALFQRCVKKLGPSIDGTICAPDGKPKTSWRIMIADHTYEIASDTADIINFRERRKASQIPPPSVTATVDILVAWERARATIERNRNVPRTAANTQ